VISTFLVTHSEFVPIAFWVAVAATIAIGWPLFHYKKRRALLILAGVGVLGMLALTMSPSSSTNPSFCTVQFSLPFQGIETLANIAMTIPATVFAAFAVRRPLMVFAAVSGSSVAIELLQALIPGLGRACDTNDWLMNTVGAAIAALAVWTIIAAEARISTRRGIERHQAAR
jgi:hypothetical protein